MGEKEKEKELVRKREINRERKNSIEGMEGEC